MNARFLHLSALLAATLAVAPGTPPVAANSYPDSGYVPAGGGGGAGQWRLGVTMRYASPGSILITVAPGSAAQRAGFEPGDILFSVSGQYVGYVDGRLNDLEDVLNQNADAQGRVSIYYRNVRTGRTSLTTVRLDYVGGGGGGVPVWNNTGGGGGGGGANPWPIPPGPGSYPNPGGTGGPGDWNNPPPATGGWDVPGGVPGDAGGYPPALVSMHRQVDYLYRFLLGREPSRIERHYWAKQMYDGRMTLSDVRVQLLGSSQYFDITRNSKVLWVESLYRKFLRRGAGAEELRFWVRELEFRYRGDRTRTARAWLLDHNKF